MANPAARGAMQTARAARPAPLGRTARARRRGAGSWNRARRRAIRDPHLLADPGRRGREDHLATERGQIKVNQHYQTEVEHIYAAGDVIGIPALASTSMEQARVAMCHAFDLGYKNRVHPILPMAIYTIPELASVGETEESCTKKGIPCLVGRTSYSGNARGQIVGDLQGLLKLVFRNPDKRLLGVHIVGEAASELIHVGQAVLYFRGTIDDFIAIIRGAPTPPVAKTELMARPWDSQLVREFFQALSTHGGITLHVDLLHGLNSHHIAEAAFKAVARALREAVATDPRKANAIPSTKGAL